MFKRSNHTRIPINIKHCNPFPSVIDNPEPALALLPTIHYRYEHSSLENHHCNPSFGFHPLSKHRETKTESYLTHLMQGTPRTKYQERKIHRRRSRRSFLSLVPPPPPPPPTACRARAAAKMWSYPQTSPAEMHPRPACPQPSSSSDPQDTHARARDPRSARELHHTP